MVMQNNKQGSEVCKAGGSCHTSISGWFPFFWLFSPQKLDPIHPAMGLSWGGNQLWGGRDPLPTGAASPVAGPGLVGGGKVLGTPLNPSHPRAGSGRFGAMFLARILRSVPAVSGTPSTA